MIKLLKSLPLRGIGGSRWDVRGFRWEMGLLLALLLIVTSCNTNRKKYVIGVSQCSEDSWRAKLVAELNQATYFNEDIELRIFSADDDVEQQKKQIQDLVDGGIDLLIVSPQQTSSLSSAIKKATDRHIPVILFDRMSDVKDYTAFMGADNYAIGKLLGDYVAGQLGGKGSIVEIAGEHGSSPAIERHRGFNDAIKKYPGLHIVAYCEGDWKQISGEKCMDAILERYHGPIDCVFGANDRIALGARTAIERYQQTHTSPLPLQRRGDARTDESEQHSTTRIGHPSFGGAGGGIIYVGVDALPTPGGGIEKVSEGKLTASAIYPTHGDELIQLALSILKGEPYEKMNTMETSLVTSANANVLLLQHKEVVHQDEYIKRMHNRVDSILTDLGTERILLFVILSVVIILAIVLVIIVRITRAKHRLNEELRMKNEELSREKEIAERQRDELEEQRDKLIEATMQIPPSQRGRAGERLETGEDALDGGEQNYRQENEFMQKFMAAIEENMSNADLSVEDLGSTMCLSRVQLYRKVKAMTGKSPVEIIREQRLLRSNQLLRDSSLSVSEVAYRVGFSSPSYFTKCYKDFFGKAPTDVR